jgi:CRP/FNR family cyclic AMP-dependent transcriptional regulator
MASQPNQSNQQRAIERFLEHCHIKHFAAKSCILRQGEPSDELLYVLKGSVSVLLEDDKGRELVLSYLNPGDFFGEIGLFHEIYNRTALVRARTPCAIAQIPYDKLKAMPSLYMEITAIIASQLALRLLKTNRKAGDLAFTDVSGRVARALLELSKEPDAMTHPDGIQVRVTRLELGRIVGCSREMVGRVLKELEEQHLISTKGKNIVVYGIR